ncbi:MAG: polysaccharide deacetylase family protein [Chloroflexi bacterium]|nr:polysaccharide deacetylase family protein [Chloroflexota bacterium]
MSAIPRRSVLKLGGSVLLGLAVASGLPRESAFAQGAVEVSAAEVLRGDPTRPRVALVFNVGAGFEPGLSILDTLAEKNFRATFFVMGWWADKNPEVLKAVADGGHEIASHGHSVFDLTTVSSAAVAADLEAGDASISAVTGRSTRPLWSPSAGYRDLRVRQVAASLGYRPILWTLDSLDWTYEATSNAVYERVVSRTDNGFIVVQHFDSPTTPRSTAVALPRIIDDLRATGYELTTITDLLTK